MKKTIFIFSLIISAVAFGQEDYSKRVGINTMKPKGTLDVRASAINALPVGTPQGVRFPNFTTERRTKFRNVTEGLMIYNTSLQCLEIYVNNTWKCINKN